MSTLEIKEREYGDVAIISLKGFLNADTSPQFEDSLQQLMTNNLFKIIVDFSELEYISSAGVGCFIGNIKRVRNNSGDILFLNMPPKTKRVFQLLDFQDFFKSYSDQSEALASYGGEVSRA